MYSIWDNNAYMYTHHCSITSILVNAKIEILYFVNTLFYCAGDLKDYMILLLVHVIHAYITTDKNLYGTGMLT